MQHPWDNSTIFYQQDKEGWINPAFDPRALCSLKQCGGAAICRPVSYYFFVRRSLVTSGKPALYSRIVEL